MLNIVKNVRLAVTEASLFLPKQTALNTHNCSYALNKYSLNPLCYSKAIHTQVFQIEEIKVPVSYGHIAVKAWGSSKAFPVLLFHGWLDNCGTFDKLIPLLSDKYYYMSVDFPGHGYSSHKPHGCIYTIYDLIIAVKKIIDYFKLSKLHLIGHSMGSAMASLVAIMHPEYIKKIVMIDAVKPFSEPRDIVFKNMKKGMGDYMRLESNLEKSPPVYNYDAAVERLMIGMHQEVTKESAEILLKRGCQPSTCGKGVVFSRDLRCRPIEALSTMSHELVETFMTKICCEMLVILAKNSNPYYQPDSPEMIEKFCSIYKQHSAKCIVEHVEGNHFVHLNNPERVGPLINNFLSN